MTNSSVLITFGLGAIIPAAFFIFIIVMIIKFYLQYQAGVEIQQQQLQENSQLNAEINDLKQKLEHVEKILKEVE